MTNEFRPALDTVGERVERSSYILVELTRNVGIAAAMPELAQELDQIQLVPLSDRRVLMVLVTRDHIEVAQSGGDAGSSPPLRKN